MWEKNLSSLLSSLDPKKCQSIFYGYCKILNTEFLALGINRIITSEEEIPENAFVPYFQTFKKDHTLCYLPELSLSKNGIIQWGQHPLEYYLSQSDANAKAKAKIAGHYFYTEKKISSCTMAEWEKFFLTNEMEKVVLARKNIYPLIDKEMPLDRRYLTAVNIFNQESIRHETNNTYRFFHLNSKGQIKISFTPETLISSFDGREFQTKALAGSRSIETLDEHFFHEHAHLKEEHQYVVDDIQNSFKALPYECQIKTTPTEILTLPYIKHLETKILATITSHRPFLFQLIDQMHPTPAMAGVPRNKAYKIIEQTENFVRGQFAGVMGFVSKNQICDLGVAIRMMEINDTQIELTAGVGIVKASQAKEEWAEGEKKMSLFHHYLKECPSPFFLDANRSFSLTILDQLLKNGIQSFYLSPGMRNAPLIAALQYLKNSTSPQIAIHNIFDERSAAYRALGHSKALGSASVLICTSGTAMANYMPAVIEAYKDQIPLIVISADRPYDEVFAGGNQTIAQAGLYGDFVVAKYNLPVVEQNISLKNLASAINYFFHQLKITPGPGHINIGFREPLNLSSAIAIQTPLSVKIADEAMTLFEKDGPSCQYSYDLAPFIKAMNESSLTLYCIGKTTHCDLSQFIENLPVHKSFILIDVASGLKFKYPLCKYPHILPNLDHPEMDHFLHNIKNKLTAVIKIGDLMLSKKLGQIIFNSNTTKIYSLNNKMGLLDPQYNIDHHFHLAPHLLNGVVLDDCETKKIPSAHYPYQLNFDLKHQRVEESPLAFPYISKKVIEALPHLSHVFLANSTTIRSFDSYINIHEQKKWHVYSNRGVSGIEGMISTVLGIMDQLPPEEELYLILGDISFMYDLNALYQLSKDTGPFLKIILINNQSGGIFSLLPIREEKAVLQEISSPHSENFKQPALMFGMNYLFADNKDHFNFHLTSLISSKCHTLFEIQINNETNIHVYENLKTIK